MVETVYALCALTSLLCAVLLFRGYRRSGTRLLLWSSACFLGFFLNNVLLLVDLSVPLEDLSIWRSLPALAGTLVLVYGLVWETRA
ncbi:hypothetical protein BH23GEM2_BH23GEM2_06800 [soil metagenome]